MSIEDFTSAKRISKNLCIDADRKEGRLCIEILVEDGQPPIVWLDREATQRFLDYVNQLGFSPLEGAENP